MVLVLSLPCFFGQLDERELHAGNSTRLLKLATGRMKVGELLPVGNAVAQEGELLPVGNAMAHLARAT
jgi:hypothetical protein